MSRLRSLTARLVLVAVALVALVSILIAGATVLAMRAYLTAQLDDRVASAAESLEHDSQRPGPGPQFGNLGPGALIVGFQNGERVGFVLREGFADPEPLSSAQVQQILASDDDARSLEVSGHGTFRVRSIGAGEGRGIVGLPAADVDDSVQQLLTVVVLLALGGIACAGVAGLVVVRRQLAPLREVAATAHRVAELPLAAGEIEMTERVPGRLTDERSEVGQVGSALNAMLDHVEDSLAQRHRSELQVRQFVADASHELRTPLATIAGYTELARRRPETSGTALDKVETESARMTGLVEDLLLLARLDAGRPLERDTVDLSRLLLEAVDDARVVDRDRSWRLALPDEPLVVAGDEARLHQVVSNLLANARKHTPPGSTITVTGTPEGFSVHDDGPGFAPELVPHAFERFTRGDAARTRGGAGLGLSLVEAIVAAHGGSVALASSPGDTTVTVRLASTSA
ncbi:HAMP domain-containing sensor histidine kinase [Microbacterium sp. ARD31]|uniref:sensor histidine kinase n=1 Tax=Microbacterium sp. ARD31 TaxID=2962576 RepID=UPI0028821347|nr:HAMP domain-containing sensor histidine kinase [Microbacterium sp. ARD31]MDT0185366.1 HAMP domain-containing sensor histidine kinase [Microbacterium sp. ARD31]